MRLEMSSLEMPSLEMSSLEVSSLEESLKNSTQAMMSSLQVSSVVWEESLTEIFLILEWAEKPEVHRRL